jgi:hypothetical protein
MDRDKLVPGQMPTYGDHNALLDGVRESSSPTGAGDSELVPAPGGFSLHDYKQKGHWAKITGGGTGGKYSHVKVLTVHDGTNPDLTPDGDQFAVWGSTMVNPAVERNGLTTVPVGAIVWLMPDEFGAYHYNFTYGSGSSGSTSVGVASAFPDALGRFVVSYHLVSVPGGASLPTGTYSIAGRVTRDGTTAAAGVRVYSSDGRTAITDSNGDYTFSSLPAMVVRIQVETIDNDTVSPAGRQVTLPSSATGQDFDITTVP